MSETDVDFLTGQGREREQGLSEEDQAIVNVPEHFTSSAATFHFAVVILETPVGERRALCHLYWFCIGPW